MKATVFTQRPHWRTHEFQSVALCVCKERQGLNLNKDPIPALKALKFNNSNDKKLRKGK
jgi:hypothetical protein